MKYLKLFESFDDIDSICKRYGIKNYTINDDGSVDVEGDIYLYRRGLTELPLKFRNVSGDFDCSENRLTTLNGCPESVGGYFHCENNEIRTLEVLPKHIGAHFPVGAFLCYDNPFYELWELFKDIDDVELFNDFGITDGEVVILDRLNEFLEMIGISVVIDTSGLEKEGYKII